MWNMILERMPSMFIITLAILSALLPWGIYKINRTLHHYADPPWKRDNEKQ
ncbi:hypothetical protein [Fredinandcohnia sp. FSL W7-1320]|uniref:hypothetical protein n=1 Tax=Fredinandcohnia sp. FSL W7-1320 TaxID=2954540 RepID=UPI0014053A5A